MWRFAPQWISKEPLDKILTTDVSVDPEGAQFHACKQGSDSGENCHKHATRCPDCDPRQRISFRRRRGAAAGRAGMTNTDLSSGMVGAGRIARAPVYRGQTGFCLLFFLLGVRALRGTCTSSKVGGRSGAGTAPLSRSGAASALLPVMLPGPHNRRPDLPRDLRPQGSGDRSGQHPVVPADTHGGIPRRAVALPRLSRGRSGAARRCPVYPAKRFSLAECDPSWTGNQQHDSWQRPAGCRGSRRASGRTS